MGPERACYEVYMSGKKISIRRLVMTPNHIRLLPMAMFLVCAATALASTTRYVNGVSGSDSNSCTSPTTACKTIGHAISLAASGDLIRVASAIYTENLTIDRSLTIAGSGAPTTIVDGGGVNRVFTISEATAHVALSSMTIRNGLAKGTGGGILNSGVLRVIASTVSGNTSFGGSSGGGITNSTGATLTISRSTVSGNVAAVPCNPIFNHWCGSIGGGIYNQGRLTVNNSTIAGNGALKGGGIGSGGTAAINNCTIARNFAGSGGGILAVAATLQNSILANNFAGNCAGGFVMTSKGYNLSSDSSCNFTGPGDLNNTDPMLGPLQYNGGPTQTMALPSGSPAVDAGNPSGCTDSLGHLLTTDQRGKPRPDTEDTGGCDMGAYERQSD
jgi:hypothetical protein